jgi:phosphoglycerate kinase
MKDGDVLCLENTASIPGEEKNDPAFVAELAKLGDLYVNDAFSAAHRAHASTEGVGHKLPAYAGRSMQARVERPRTALDARPAPVIAIVGGAKVSSKIDLLENLVGKVDALVIGGGMANTFLHAQGHKVGKSLCEKDLADTAREIIRQSQSQGCDHAAGGRHRRIHASGAKHPSHAYGDAIPDEMILDVGPASHRAHQAAIAMPTLVWNGPLGAFEMTALRCGTVAAPSTPRRCTKAKGADFGAGGGDTVAALNHAGVSR